MGLAQFDTNKNKEVTIVGTERTKYFDGIGTDVQAANNLETAIKLSGLNFKVEKKTNTIFTRN